MATMTLRMFPKGLGIATAVRMVLPTTDEIPGGDFKAYYGAKRPYPVLWLLHGGTDDYASWHDCTTVELLAKEYGCAVVMPDAQNSSYSDMAHGPRWFTYFSQELPRILRAHFPLSAAREENFLSGMSMGGYGALKLGLRYPERYGKVAGIATGVGIPEKYIAQGDGADFGRMFSAIFGREEDRTRVRGSDEDCYFLLKDRLESGRTLPKLMLAAGTEDFTYGDNVKFRDYVRSLGVPVHWEEAPGVHDWKSWNYYLPLVFRWLFEEDGAL